MPHDKNKIELTKEAHRLRFYSTNKHEFMLQINISEILGTSYKLWMSTCKIIQIVCF